MKFLDFIRRQFAKEGPVLKATDKRVLALERMRVEWQTCWMEVADRWDYLDYGQPSPVEKKKVESIIGELTPKEAEAKAALGKMVAFYRANDMAVLREWAAMHVRICDHLVSLPPEESHNESTRISVLENTRKDWFAMPENLEMDFYINQHYIPAYWAILSSMLEEEP